jgi:hypothetical protein
MPTTVFQSHMFQKLRQHGRKELKFQQRKSVKYTDPRMPGGVCLGITMDWITEQIKTDAIKGAQRLFQSRLLANRTKENEKLMRSAMASQQASSGKSTAVVSEYHGIKWVPNVGHFAEGGTNDAVVEAIVQSSFHRYLPSRRAVFIDFYFLDAGTKMSVGGHSIALYRNSKAELYFFDSNCGVYVVHNLRGLIREWLSGYENGRHRLVRILSQRSFFFFEALENV